MIRRIQLAGSILAMVLLSLPAIQSTTGFAPVRGLGGVESAPRDVEGLTLRSWSSGSYQQSLEDQLSHHLGLRDWIVRLDNEIRWRVFGSTKRPVVPGR